MNMSNKFDPRCHIGETHGIYTIVDVLNEKDKYGHYIYKAVCGICGHEKYAHYGAISGQKSVTTQCKHLRANGQHLTYGHIWDNKRIARIFNHMVDRCYNVNNKDYHWYGEKGIGICQAWLDSPLLFEKWALENGYQDQLTIDRIDADKDYYPDNCQWVTLEVNARKAGKVNWITVKDKTLTGKQWSKKLGIGINTINRIVRNYGLDKAIELIEAMLKYPHKISERKSNQNWFDVYGIQI